MSNLSRKKSRKFLFQKLFSDNFVNNNTELFGESFLIDSFKGNLDNDYIDEMINLIKKYERELIYVLSKYAGKFDLKSMSVTYVFPIFIGATEMLYLKEEIPAKVSINEAIEISKTYGDSSASKMVNGVLAKLYDNIVEIKKELENVKIEKDFSFFEK